MKQQSGIPQDILDALRAAGLAEFFADCTPSHQREYLKWIGEAKKPETRKVRIQKALQMLVVKQKQETAGR